MDQMIDADNRSVEALLEAAAFIELKTSDSKDEGESDSEESIIPLGQPLVEVYYDTYDSSQIEENVDNTISEVITSVTKSPIKKMSPCKRQAPGPSREVHRDMHNLLEKNRRAILREGFEKLKKELPHLEYGDKMSNLSILRNAVRYIKVLERRSKNYENSLKKQQKRLHDAAEKVSDLKNKLGITADSTEFDAYCASSEIDIDCDSSSSTTTASEGPLSDSEFLPFPGSSKYSVSAVSQSSSDQSVIPVSAATPVPAAPRVYTRQKHVDQVEISQQVVYPELSSVTNVVSTVETVPSLSVNNSNAMNYIHSFGTTSQIIITSSDNGVPFQVVQKSPMKSLIKPRQASSNAVPVEPKARSTHFRDTSVASVHTVDPQVITAYDGAQWLTVAREEEIEPVEVTVEGEIVDLPGDVMISETENNDILVQEKTSEDSVITLSDNTGSNTQVTCDSNVHWSITEPIALQNDEMKVIYLLPGDAVLESQEPTLIPKQETILSANIDDASCIYDNVLDASQVLIDTVHTTNAGSAVDSSVPSFVEEQTVANENGAVQYITNDSYITDVVANSENLFIASVSEPAVHKTRSEISPAVVRLPRQTKEGGGMKILPQLPTTNVNCHLQPNLTHVVKSRFNKLKPYVSATPNSGVIQSKSLNTSTSSSVGTVTSLSAVTSSLSGKRAPPKYVYVIKKAKTLASSKLQENVTVQSVPLAF